LIFVAKEPINAATSADVSEENAEFVQSAIENLASKIAQRNGSLQLREIGGGWQTSTQTEFYDEVCKFLKPCRTDV
jgi:chromosome segregation and condensation protein ScpB